MVEAGNKVRVRYTCALDDGTVVDSSVKQGGTFEFVVGSERVLSGVNRAVLGMRTGEHRRVVVPAAEAYGEYDPALIERVPASDIPNADKLPIGGYVEFYDPSGNVRVRVNKIEDGQIYFDHNHELAGKDLTFDIDLLYVYGESGSLVENEKFYAHEGCSCGCDKLKESLTAANRMFHHHHDAGCSCGDVACAG